MPKVLTKFCGGPLLLIPLLGTGLLFTFKLKWIQISKLKTAIKQVTVKPEVQDTEEVGLSPLQSLATAIAAQVGTGNLAGVATAIVSGGDLVQYFGCGLVLSLVWQLFLPRQY